MLLLLSLFLAPALAIIPLSKGTLLKVFAVVDADSNGVLTKEELVSLFQQVDLNRDGIVFEAELLANFPIGAPHIPADILCSFLNIDSVTGFTKKDIDLIFIEYDINLDGKITLEEQTVQTARDVVGV